jgi:phosphoglycerate dehydrogenase-like enzyme
VGPMRICFVEPIGIPVQECRTALAGQDVVDVDSRGWPDEELIAAVGDAEILVLTNRPISARVIESLPNLRLIAVAFTGIDHVDPAAVAARHIPVLNAAGYADVAVAELVIGLMIALARGIPESNEAIRHGGESTTGTQLRGKTVGIIGDGAIGREVEQLANGLGMAPLVHGLDTGTTLADVVAASDFVTLHVPLLPSTRDMISLKLLASMKPGAFLVNCARGPIVNSTDLLTALDRGMIAGAALDVFDVEPPLPHDYPLLQSPKVIATPHLGFNTQEALVAKGRMTLDHIVAFLATAQ